MSTKDVYQSMHTSGSIMPHFSAQYARSDVDGYIGPFEAVSEATSSKKALLFLLLTILLVLGTFMAGWMLWGLPGHFALPLPPSMPPLPAHVPSYVPESSLAWTL